MASKRYNFTISKKTAKKLSSIRTGQRSRFVEDAINEKFLVEERKIFIEKYKKSKKPIWADENHQDLKTLEDIASYNPLSWRKRAS